MIQTAYLTQKTIKHISIFKKIFIKKFNKIFNTKTHTITSILCVYF